MKIFIASDHAGYTLKERIKQNFSEIEFIDLGTNSADVSVDYPDYSHDLADKIGQNFGILICGTGIGISIAANRHENIRCALCHDVTTARLAREHNNANVISFGARVIGEEIAFEMINVFLNTKFLGQRHQRRVEKINIKRA
ncbi:Putative sugar phosphate isomerase YwlF [Campylobacter majalis]|uniref:Sugar phosphate isomerase YwlF n=1 Tax=Campylobacter majalis TaxID=2790656 RepID=A0ABM8Q2N3_9BACT|nr:ribose 5-phosphate isomerase B [Campylobacter majalis]CAD7287011.1 Putative sugar phosphate isomerase YwlF [Campylobacter majalis]